MEILLHTSKYLEIFRKQQDWNYFLDCLRLYNIYIMFRTNKYFMPK